MVSDLVSALIVPLRPQPAAVPLSLRVSRVLVGIESVSQIRGGIRELLMLATVQCADGVLKQDSKHLHPLTYPPRQREMGRFRAKCVIRH